MMMKKRKLNLRKAPQAPKRFRSSFILFYTHVQNKIKTELGGKASAPIRSKRASEMWKALNDEDRQIWHAKAKKEKEQYADEKAAYTGPWKVAHKRAKKDPTAPKRNPSAFLLFTQEKRQEIKNLNPGMKITKIARILGQLWRDMPIERKRPLIERELKERDQYMANMAEWKRQQELKRQTETVPSPLSTIDESDGSRELQPVLSGRNNGIANTCHEDVVASELYSYPSLSSFSSSSSQCDYDTTIHPTHTIDHYHQHRYPHIFPNYPNQEQCTQYFDTSGRYRYHRQDYLYSRHEWDGRGYDNHGHFKIKSSSDIDETRTKQERNPAHVQHQEDERDGATHHQRCSQKRSHRHDLQSSIGKDMFDVFMDYFDDSKDERKYKD